VSPLRAESHVLGRGGDARVKDQWGIRRVFAKGIQVRRARPRAAQPALAPQVRDRYRASLAAELQVENQSRAAVVRDASA
jgi:hypothetical protein